MLDIERVRDETPFCEEYLHLNNAGCSPTPLPVRKAINVYLDRESFGGYEAAEEGNTELREVYDSLAKLIGASSEDIAMTGSGVEGWQLMVLAFPFKAGDVVVTGEAEYGSNLIQLNRIKEIYDITVRVVESDDKGQIGCAALRDSLDERVKLIALTHAPTNGALINPARAVGVIAREFDIPYILDAVQTVGHLPVSVAEIGCDMLVGTSRKYLRGPRGAGFLYVSPRMRTMLNPLLRDNYNSSLQVENGRMKSWRDARKFERYERSYANQIGLGAAAKYALDLGIESIFARIRILSRKLREDLRNIPGVQVKDVGEDMSGIVTFTTAFAEPDIVKNALRSQKINVGISRRVSTPYDMDRRGMSSLVRVSPHYFNTTEEIHRFVDSIRALKP